RDHGRHRGCRGPDDPAAAAHDRGDAEAGSRGRRMTGPRKYPTADRVLGTVLTGSGHRGLPNVVVGLTGSGNVILGCLQARAVPDSLSRSVPVTRAAI